MLEPQQPLTWERIAILLGIGGILFAGSILFNRWIDKQAEKNPNGPGTGMYVVIGTGYTLVASFLALCLIFGFESALTHMLVVFACFALSGVPMVFGAIGRNNQRQLVATIDEENQALNGELEGIVGGKRS